MSEPKDVQVATRTSSEGAPQAEPAVQQFRSAVALLTTRERQILTLVAQGLANKAIARELCITERTVKAHLGAIFRKMHVTNRVQATLAFRQEEEAIAGSLDSG